MPIPHFALLHLVVSPTSDQSFKDESFPTNMLFDSKGYSSPCITCKCVSGMFNGMRSRIRGILKIDRYSTPNHDRRHSSMQVICNEFPGMPRPASGCIFLLGPFISSLHPIFDMPTFTTPLADLVPILLFRHVRMSVEKHFLSAAGPFRRRSGCNGSHVIEKPHHMLSVIPSGLTRLLLHHLSTLSSHCIYSLDTFPFVQ